MIEPIAASVPYMVTPGNHDKYQNFSHYTNRFTMPGKSNGLWYSFDQGDVHFVMYSSEVYYYYLEPSPQLMIDQFKWLEEDLKVCKTIVMK